MILISFGNLAKSSRPLNLKIDKKTLIGNITNNLFAICAKLVNYNVLHPFPLAKSSKSLNLEMIIKISIGNLNETIYDLFAQNLVNYEVLHHFSMSNTFLKG